MDYKKIFSPETIKKLDKKSNDNLKQMLGDKNLVQTLQSSQKLLSDIAKAEAPYKDKLEKLAVKMVKELYPIIEEEGIVLDAKLVGMSDVGKELDEIKVNDPTETIKKIHALANDLKYCFGSSIDDLSFEERIKYLKDNFSKKDIDQEYQEMFGDKPLDESISPEGRRRVINAITQGSALRGAFAFYLFKEHLDEIDPSLVEKYNQIMKNTFGLYDDPNVVAMALSLLAQGHKGVSPAGGSSKVIIKEIKVNNPTVTPEKTKEFIKKHNLLTNKNYMDLVDKMLHGEDEMGFDWDGEGENEEGPLDFIDELSKTKLQDFYNELQDIIKKPLNEAEQSGITIKARAICFPMLVHELIKGLYELISLQGFKGDKKSNQDIVNKVDKLEHEPSDIRFGKFIYDALNDLFAKSKYDNPKIREFFFIEIYKLDDNDFISLIENSINENLTQEEKNWVEKTLKEIDDDLKTDEANKYIDENLFKV